MKNVISLACLMLVSFVASAQFIALRGRIVDSATQVIITDADIFEVNSNAITSSNGKGEFEIKGLKPGVQILHIHHVGCERVVLTYYITKDTFLHINLKHHSHVFETHVVHGRKNEAHHFVDHDKELNGLGLEMNQHKSMGEMLQEINGVHAIKTGAAISKPVIRGMAGNRVSIVSSGLKLESQQWGDDHAPEISSRDANNVIVLKGAGTLRYGYDAIGGIILVEPRPFSDSLYVNLGSAFISNGRGINTFGSVSNTTKKLKWHLNSAYKKMGDQHAPTYMLSNTAFEEWNSALHLGYKVKRLEMETRLAFFHSKPGILKASHIGNLSDLNSAIEAEKPKVILPFSYQIGRPFQLVNHATLLQKAQVKWHKHALHVNYGLQYNQRKEFDNKRGTVKSSPQLNFNLITHSFEAILNSKLSKSLEFTTGYQGSYQVNMQSGFLLIPNFNRFTQGVLGIMKFEKERYLAELGGRIDVQHLNSFFYDEKGTIAKPKEFVGTSFNGSLQYQVNTDWMFFTQFAALWRAPSVNELFSNGLHHGAAAIEYGNENLKKERSTSFSTTWVYSHNKFGFELEPHIRYVQDFISLQPSLPPELTIRGAFPVFHFDAYDVWIKGIDMQWNYVLAKNVIAKAQYSALQVKQTNGNGAYLNGMPPVSFDHQIKYFIAHFKQFTSINLNLGYKYTCRQIWANERLDYANTPKGFGLLRSSISAEIRKKKVVHSFSLALDNLLNTSYRDYMSRLRYFADQEGINAVIQYQIKF